MRRYLLYVSSPSQVKEAKEHISRLELAVVQRPGQPEESFTLTHSSLGSLEIKLNMLDDLKLVSGHLKQYPVDMLIYDERGHGADAVSAVEQIKQDVELLAESWGPDFHFPMGRILAILTQTEDTPQKIFTLGRDGVRDVLINPRHIGKTLRWIIKILTEQKNRGESKVGMALSGGGLEGFLFQVGCCYALERALSERSLYDSEVFSGVSSGSIAASILACQVPIKEVVDSLYGRSKVLESLKTKNLYDLATGNIAQRMLNQGVSWVGIDPTKWIQKSLRSIPTGFFKGDGLRRYVADTLKVFGCEDSFENLGSELYIGATHQDSFEHVVLGTPPWNKIKVSDAVRASCALPPFFTPMHINDQGFIDGQITRTCNLELVVNKGCKLIFIIDPIKPYSTFEKGFVEAEGGAFTLIQSIKTLVYSRFRSTLAHLTERYPDIDFIVLQPYDECAELMAGSPMKLWFNTKILDLAYRSTLRRLRSRHHVYSAKMAKFGFNLAPAQLLLDMERKGIE